MVRRNPGPEIDFQDLRWLNAKPNREVPILGVVGERDAITPPSAQATLRQMLPKAMIETIPGGGHRGIVYDHADDLSEVLISFYEIHN